jgi:hypothetical protein
LTGKRKKSKSAPLLLRSENLHLGGNMKALLVKKFSGLLTGVLLAGCGVQMGDDSARTPSPAQQGERVARTPMPSSSAVTNRWERWRSSKTKPRPGIIGLLVNTN